MIGGLIVTAVSFLICEPFRNYYNSSVRDQIIVVPNKLHLATTSRDVTKIFEIKNRNPDQTFFAVWLKLYRKEKGSNLNNIQITSGDDQPFIPYTVGDYSVDLGVLKLQGLDSSGRPCIYFIFYALKSIESRSFKVKKLRSPQAVRDSVDLVLEVKRFSKNPTEIITEEGAAGLEIKPPESMQIQSLGVLVKKNF